jgi:hypothetical protein
MPEGSAAMHREFPETPELPASAPKLSALQDALSLVCLAPPKEDVAVEAGFASDILSEVLARAPEKCVLVTSQTNINVVAVASYAGIAGVIVTSGHRPAPEVVERAREEGIGVYSTCAETFDVVGMLARMGLTGRQRSGLPCCAEG